MRRRGKKYQETAKKYNRTQIYDLEQAVGLVRDMAYAKFDETVSIHFNLNMKKGVSVRDTVVLPNQFGKEKKILVFARGEKADEATQAGATYVGDQDLIDKIKEGWMDFDVAISTPDLMKDVGKLGAILGRRGLMPNPKSQTVTFNIKAAIDELRKGRMEFRADKAGVIHLAVGKISMEQEKIQENLAVVIAEVKRKKPSDIKGDFVKTIVISSTMGPGVKISL